MAVLRQAAGLDMGCRADRGEPAARGEGAREVGRGDGWRGASLAEGPGPGKRTGAMVVS